MTEEIYIDGTLMDLDAGKTNVQLIYQSPVLTDFQSVVSNRTTNVTLPLTQNNLNAIGFVGTQADSDFPYKKHSVIYKRDGVQLLSGFATLLSIKASTISFCFTWGNTKAMESLFNTSLRALTSLGRCKYPAALTDSSHGIPFIDFGGGRSGVGVKVEDILTAIQNQCGVTGLMNLCKPHASGDQRYWLALTTRNGDNTTRAYQATIYGTPRARMWKVNDNFYLTTLYGGSDASDPHGYMNEYGIIDVSGTNILRIDFNGSFEDKQYGTSFQARTMKLIFNTGDGWNYDDGITLCTPTYVTSEGGIPVYRYSENDNFMIDVSEYQKVAIAIMADIGNYEPTLRNVNVTKLSITKDPYDNEECMYNATSENVYPIWQNLPDMSCGQLIKNLLWLRGEFAYSQNGKDFQIVSFNQLQENKKRAIDWTDKMKSSSPTERQTKLDGTARTNYFRYTEADFYDNTRYEGSLITSDETIDAECEYCKSDFALCPDNKIPIWTQNEDGEWDFAGDNIPPVLLYSYPLLVVFRYTGYNSKLKWSSRLAEWYDQYAKIIRKPVVLKAEFVLTTYDLFSLDMTIPVYLKQTGHYYLIRKLTTKSGGVADAELVKL